MLDDLRYALRMLVKNPGFAIFSLATLALAIGPNAAIFSLINSLLLKPLPYHQPERLVWIAQTHTQYGTADMVPGRHLLDWKDESQILEKIAAFTLANQTLSGGGAPERVDVSSVSSDFFQLLGARPLFGRMFSADDDRPTSGLVAVISHSLWTRRYNSDAGIIGKSIRLDGHDHTVIGVLPPEFRFVQPFDVWRPLRLDPVLERGNRQVSMLNVVARLKPSVGFENAQNELAAIVERNQKKGAPELNGLVQLIPLHAKLVGGTRALLLILLGAVVLVLLIACTNVGNLLLSRGATRQKEFAIRTALGAGRLRLMRQIVMEGAVLAVGGAVLGLFLAKLSLQAFASDVVMSFGSIARVSTIQVDRWVLGFTILISVLATLLFGLIPAIQLSQPSLGNWLKERGQSGGYHNQRLRRMFMLAQVALAVMLLTGAGLLVRSFTKLMDVHPGYRAEHLLTMRLSLPESRYAESQQSAAFFDRLLQQIKAIPGVESAGAINHLPLSNFKFMGALRIPGQPRQAHASAIPVGVVTPDYFHTMGIPLRAGRVFNEQDTAEGPRTVVISEELAKQMFPNTDPIGKLLWVPGPGATTPVVVGVVGDIKHVGLDSEITPQVYIPSQQFGQTLMALVLRTTVPPLATAGAVRQEVLRMDPELAVFDLQTMEARVADSVAPRRISLKMLSMFALLALALAAVGIYGVFSVAVTQREQEFGIRLAIGARRGSIVGLVLKESLILTAGGVVLGVGASLGATRVLSNLLFEVQPHDPPTFALVCLTLFSTALVGTLVPAWRAGRVDPMVALRSE